MKIFDYSIDPGNENPNPARQNVGTVNSLKKFITNMGWLTKIIILVNIAIYIIEAIMKWDWPLYAICLGPIKQGEYYRIISATFSHANFTHIFFNMVTMMVFSPDLERHHKFFKYSLIHIFQIPMQHIIAMLMMFGMTQVPEKFYGGPEYDYHCSIGYSGVLYGYMLLWVYVGDKEMSIFGMFKLRKVYFPWIWIILNQIIGNFW